MLQKIAIFFLFLVIFINGSDSIDCTKTVKPENFEARIKFDKFCSYDKSEKPATMDNGTTVIGFQSIVRAYKFLPNTAMFQVDMWLNLTYTEPKLSWDPTTYGNIKYVIEKNTNLWFPQFDLFNAHLEHSEPACKTSECYVWSTGLVNCLSPCTYKTTCFTNYRQWPYDQHNCTVNIGMWLIPGDYITYDFDSIRFESSYTMRHKEWNLVKSEFHEQNPKFSTNETYPSLSFSFIMERHPTFQITTVIAPALVMIVINLVSLWLDFNSMDRIILFSISLFSHLMFIQYLSWFIPKNGSQCPKVVLYFRDSLIMTTLLLVTTIIAQGLSGYQRKMPTWLESILNKIKDNRIGLYIINMNLKKDGTLIQNPEEITIKPEQDDENTKWKLMANVFDRISFIVFILVYVILMLALFPTGF